MPVTLAQATVGMANHVDHQIIDTIRRNSRFMDTLIYDDAVTPEGGSTLVYAYTQIKTPGVANGRALNTEYTPAEAERETKTTALAIMGGSYQIDRVLARNSARFTSEVAFQNEEKSKATVSRFQYLAINGDRTTTATDFDGLEKLLTGTANDFTGTTVDVSGTITQAKAEAMCEALDEAIASIQDGATAILCNTKEWVKLQACARMMGYLRQDQDAFGKVTYTYNGIELIDMGKYYNGSATVDVIAKDSSSSTAKLYVINQSKTGVHAVTPQGGVGISSNLPDFTTAGAVKTGDVEMVAAIVLKNTNNGAILKIKY